MIRKVTLLLFTAAALLLHSCVEDTLDFPNEEDAVEVTESVALVTLLNALATEELDSSNICFRFVYPIDLGFNNGIALSLENDRGLLEAVKSQSSGLHVNSISFPFQVTFRNEVRTIDNDETFRKLLRECFITTLRIRFDEVHKQCFNLMYPLTMTTPSGAEVSVESLDAFFELYHEQGLDYEPRFVFPIGLDVFSRDEEVRINSYFDLYQVINGCEGCPEMFFSYHSNLYGKYEFFADFEGIERLENYGWYVDGNLIEEERLDTGRDNFLFKEFEPGAYEVCIKAETDLCRDRSFYCELIVLECLELSFTAEEEFTGFIFTANFERRNEITYIWSAYIGDEQVSGEVREPGSGDDHNFFVQMERGVDYKICLKQDGGCDGEKICVNYILN